MDVIQIIVLIMVVTILVTITLASAAYVAFRLRDRRAPRNSAVGTYTPVFFERVRFPAVEASTDEDASGDASLESADPLPHTSVA